MGFGKVLNDISTTKGGWGGRGDLKLWISEYGTMRRSGRTDVKREWEDDEGEEWEDDEERSGRTMRRGVGGRWGEEWEDDEAEQ